MICCKPYVQGVHAFPCGQCPPCRINRAKTWSHRIYLESLKHAESSFVTLTYSPEFLPVLPSRMDGLATLRPLDLTLFLKRLRKALGHTRIRYFAVGEYGDNTYRPHYHLAVFGIGPSYAGVVDRSWNMGHTMVGELNEATSKYIGGYVTKKIAVKDDEFKARGLHPEFARMSNRPGIGALAIPDIAASLLAVENGRCVALMDDVPTSLLMGRKSFPLGRYLRRKLRAELGLPPGAPAEVLAQWEAEMRLVLETEFGPASHSNPWTRERIKNYLIESSANKVLNIESRFNLFKQKRSI